MEGGASDGIVVFFSKMNEKKDDIIGNFKSNDYLGLSKHPLLTQVVSDAVLRFGCGSTGSRLMSGNHVEFEKTEDAISKWVGKEASAMFNSGFQMNSTIFKVWCTDSTLVIADKWVHASLIDGILHSSATLRRFRHNDTHHLDQILKMNQGCYDQIIIVCESIYSMDGDTCPIQDIIRLKNQYQAILVVDEAHSIGCYGQNGNGWLNAQGVIESVDIVLLTFGKAFGLCGAMVMGRSDWINQIKRLCRGYIYTTALPIPIAVGIQFACQLISEGSHFRQQLMDRISFFKSMVSTPSSTAIQPLFFNDVDQASRYLQSKGYLVHAVHSPTVPVGQSRIRISILASHRPDQIQALASCLQHLQYA